MISASSSRHLFKRSSLLLAWTVAYADASSAGEAFKRSNSPRNCCKRFERSCRSLLSRSNLFRRLLMTLAAKRAFDAL